MILVHYDPACHAVTVSGHAGFGIEGTDTVCAWVSAITYTIAKNIAEFDLAGMLHPGKTVIRMERGDASIRCSPHKRSVGEVSLVLDALCEGYALISSNYPDYVRYTVGG